MENFEDHNLGDESKFGRDMSTYDENEIQSVMDKMEDPIFNHAQKEVMKTEELASKKDIVDMDVGKKEKEMLSGHIQKREELVKKMLESVPGIRDHIDRLIAQKNEIASKNMSTEEKESLINPINKKIADYVKIMSDKYIQKDELEVLKRNLEEDKDRDMIVKTIEKVTRAFPAAKNIADPNYRFRDN